MAPGAQTWTQGAAAAVVWTAIAAATSVVWTEVGPYFIMDEAMSNQIVDESGLLLIEEY